MSRETSEIDKLKADNQVLRESLLWAAKNSLDSATRVRADEALRRIDPNFALNALRKEAEIYGEWCI